jgi:hypothetical protein
VYPERICPAAFFLEKMLPGICFAGYGRSDFALAEQIL